VSPVEVSFIAINVTSGAPRENAIHSFASTIAPAGAVARSQA
jgi:hypothetical protein